MPIPEFAVDQLKALLKLHGTWKEAKRHAGEVYTQIGFTPSIQEIYDAVHDLDERARFAACGKEKRFDGFWGGYRFCGTLKTCPCAVENTKTKSEITNLERFGHKRPLQNKTVQEKMKQTNLTRYGVEHAQSTKEVRDKVKATNLARYGSECATKNQTVKDKIKETNIAKYGVEHVFNREGFIDQSKKTILEKYGVEHIGQSQEIKDKIKKTNLARYGAEHTFQVDSFKEKSANTMLEKYGVTHVSKSDIINDKIRQTNLDRYGVERPFMAKQIRDKVSDTAFEKYGVRHAMQSPVYRDEVKEKIQKRFGTEHGSNCHIDIEVRTILKNKDLLFAYAEGKTLNLVAYELGVDPKTVLNYWHKHELPVFQSRYEEIISEWLTSMGVSYIRSTRKMIGRLELDFYLPDFKIGIEFNGIYWHSSAFKDSGYHRRKFEACRANGIRLFMINEDEWITNSDAIKSHVNHVLGLSIKKEAARKLTVREIPNTIANSFFAEYHIQGKTGNLYKSVGAFCGDTLVGAMSFNKQRGTGRTELIRFCSDYSSRAGLFSKLFSFSTKTFDLSDVISFADLRYSNGDVYRNNGFQFDGEIAPDYRYVKRFMTYHKSGFTKTKIAKKFGLDMAQMTEHEAMESLKFNRIYDCGKLRFVWKKV